VPPVLLRNFDYGGATLACLPARLLERLQSVLNAAAWLVFGSRKYYPAIQLLRDLRWLRLPRERITFRFEVLVYRCQHGFAPPRTLLMNFDVWLTRQLMRPASSAALVVPGILDDW